MILSNEATVNALINHVLENLKKTQEMVSKVLIENDASEALAILKFDKAALDPISGEKINFIEMLNQTYSDIVVLKAVKVLLDQYPDKSFEVHMGALTGSDIESTDKEVVAECFATVTAFNNQKIKKDSEKISKLDDSIKKYIFFYSREDSAERIEKFIVKYPQINYVRILDFAN